MGLDAFHRQYSRVEKLMPYRKTVSCTSAISETTSTSSSTREGARNERGHRREEFPRCDRFLHKRLREAGLFEKGRGGGIEVSKESWEVDDLGWIAIAPFNVNRFSTLEFLGFWSPVELSFQELWR